MTPKKMKNKEKILSLIDQLLSYSVNADRESKADSTKASDKIGNDFMAFHLKMLKDLIDDE